MGIGLYEESMGILQNILHCFGLEEHVHSPNQEDVGGSIQHLYRTRDEHEVDDLL